MKFGLSMFPTDYAIPVTELAKAAEDLGFESLLFPEHTHIPVGRRTPYPGGGELPREYSHTLDPFVACAAAAAVTRNLKVGTGVCLVMQRDPIVLAKEVASVDHLSGGRFLFGIGGGWNEDEMENHGTKPSLRWKILRERIAAMKELWTKDEAEYHGQFVDFGPAWSWPKPVQQPNPPILMGGAGPRTLERVIEYGDEWMPIAGRSGDVLAAKIEELQVMAKAAGRAPIPVTIFGSGPSAAAIERFDAMGIHRVLFALRPGDTSDVLGQLRRYADFVKQL
jgi:probable F420-dependent oxidoreductase